MKKVESNLFQLVHLTNIREQHFSFIQTVKCNFCQRPFIRTSNLQRRLCSVHRLTMEKAKAELTPSLIKSDGHLLYICAVFRTRKIIIESFPGELFVSDYWEFLESV